MSNALEVRDLHKVYPGFTLNNISFELPAGYIMGFVGQNGAGKTTTIRLILNMAKREGGSVSVFGLDNVHDELAVKQQVAAVFDEIFFVDSWRVREVEKAVSGFYSRWDSPMYTALLKEFGLSPDKRVKELSRGMKLKLMLATAMSHEAKLLVLDEPTSGLDPVARDELLDILREYIADGEKSVFFSTHITSDLEQIADYITVIDRGRIFYTGTKDGLLDHFLAIQGSPEDLPEPLRKSVIGFTQSRTRFTGLIRAADRETVPASIVCEAPTIDEVLVHISKDGGRHE
jgi:ABC-2 type transport system ATP-binding protein